MDTKSIVDAALQDLQQEKQEKKYGKKQQGKRKGLTLEQLEAAEGATVRESQVGMASTKRAKTRKGTTKDTDLVDNLEEAEEELEKEEEEGVAFEPFNLAQERREGHFDEGGHWVEEKADDEDLKDAWLGSDTGVVSEATRRRIAQRAQQRQLADEQPELSGAQAAAKKADMAELLHAGETVSRAMKRLRPPAARKGKKQAAGQQPEADSAQQEQYKRLKAGADALMDAGEMDAYDLTREDLQRGAALFAPAAANNDEDDDDDMFADPEAPAKPSALTSSQPIWAAAQPSAQDAQASEAQPHTGVASADAAHQAAANAQPAQQPAVDYASWPIKELRRFLQERGQSSAGIVDKAELVSKVAQLAAQGPEGAAASAAVPAGYVYDASSGYHYSAEADLYYDKQCSAFFSSSAQKWYVYNADGQLVEWQHFGN